MKKYQIKKFVQSKLNNSGFWSHFLNKFSKRDFSIFIFIKSFEDMKHVVISGPNIVFF